MSRLKEDQVIRGEVKIILKDIKSKEVTEERRVPNAIVNTGRELIAKLLAGKVTGGITKAGVGSNGSATIPAMIALQGEITDGKVDISSAEVSMNNNDAKVTLKATFGETVTGALQEAGLFAGTTMYNRVVFDVINKGSNHELTLEWSISFPA